MEKLKLTIAERIKLDSYPKVFITQTEFDNLPEYSLSTPTQDKSVGIKKWKLRTPTNASVINAIWFLGEIKEDMNIFSYIIIKQPPKP